MLEVFCCYINLKNKNSLENYWTFRKNLECPIKTIELSFDKHFDIEDAIHVQGGLQNMNWQKERLLNILIEQSKWDKVAWIEPKIIFNNKNWWEEAVEKLKTTHAVQLFGDVKDNENNFLKGCVRSKKLEGSETGLAWASRKESMPEGLIDDFLGTANSRLVCSWTGNWGSRLFKKDNNYAKQLFLRKGIKYHQIVKGNIDFVQGTIKLLEQNMNTEKLMQEILSHHNFIPNKDIKLDENGLWKWSSDKPEMHRKVAELIKWK